MRIVTVLVLVAACADSPVRMPDECADLGCAVMPGTLTLTILDDVTAQPVAGTPSFTANGQAMPFQCSTLAMPCPAWTLSYLGAFDVEVALAGYQTRTIHVVIEGPEGCCGAGPDTSDTLLLPRE